MIASGLVFIANNRANRGEFLEELTLEMPNVRLKTMGGNVFWDELVSAGGWKLQRNRVFGNWRILNNNNERVAWGGESAMLRAFNRISQS